MSDTLQSLINIKVSFPCFIEIKYSISSILFEKITKQFKICFLTQHLILLSIKTLLIHVTYLMRKQRLRKSVTVLRLIETHKTLTRPESVPCPFFMKPHVFSNMISGKHKLQNADSHFVTVFMADPVNNTQFEVGSANAFRTT